MIALIDIAKGFMSLRDRPITEYAITDASGGLLLGFQALMKAEYKSGGKVVSENIEENSFATYNKTSEPREFEFDVAIQFPNQDIAGILSKLEELKKGTDLFNFVTPYNVYNDLTLEGYSTVFESFTSMLIVSLQCKEVIQVQQGYTNVKVKDATPIESKNAKNADNVDTVNTGITQTSTPSATETKAAEESILYRTTGSIL